MCEDFMCEDLLETMDNLIFYRDKKRYFIFLTNEDSLLHLFLLFHKSDIIYNHLL
jgi:hypothetical protein